MKKEVKKILFVCKYNRFRSKVGESIFNELNNNRKMKAESAGTIMSGPVTGNVIKVMKEKGYRIKNLKSQYISSDVVASSDIIVIVADNVSRSIFKKYHKKVIVWKISDTSQYDVPGITERVGQIEERVRKLIDRYN